MNWGEDEPDHNGCQINLHIYKTEEDCLDEYIEAMLQCGVSLFNPQLTMCQPSP